MPDLVLRLIGDATSGLRAVDRQILALGKLDTATGESTRITELSAAKRVATIEKSISSQRALIASYEELKAAAVSTGRSTVAVDIAMADANSKLNRTLGVTSTGLTKTSAGAKTAENDIGKLTRGALAGSGVISSLGRSLAFASGGFIAVAGTATLLHNAITEALAFAATEKQVTAQLKTSGLSFEANKEQILANLTAQSKLSAFTRGDLLQSFGYLVRVSGDVDQSLKLTAIAADVARGRHIALSSASIALAKALGGSSTALRRLGIIVPASAKGMDAIRYVAQKFAGQAEAGATSADHLRTSLVNAGETIGTDLLPTFNRLATEFGDWIAKMDASGKLQKDANEAITVLGAAFHTLGGAIKIVDDATGGFKNTLALLIGLELGSKVYGWIKALRILAGTWGLVGAAAVRAGEEEAAAATVGGVAAGGAAGGAATGAAGGGIGSLFAGGLLGQLAGSKVRGFFAGRAAASEIGAFGAEGAATGISATGIGALGVAALLASDALAGLAKKVNDAAGGGSTGDSIISGIEGALTGGIFGNSRVGKDALTAGFYEFFRKGPPPPPPAAYRVNNTTAPFLQLPGTLGAAVSRPTAVGSPFGGAQPMQQYWKAWIEGFKLTQAALMATLTKGNADDLAVARKIVAKVKQQMDQGVLHGPAEAQALQAEANALSTIWSAEAAAAQKRAAAAAAAKQKIITQIQNAIDPINLQIALARTESLGQSTTAVLKKQLSAAYKGLAEAIANGNKQLILQAYQQITSLKQAIKDSLTTASKTFTEPMRLQIALAKAQAFGGDTTSVLRQMKAAALKALHSGKYAGQALIDLLNEIANINSQLDSSVQTAYGNFKKASVKALTASLGLTADQRRELEQRLSQRGPGGTVPGSGTGAAGYIIDPATGRPVQVGTHHHGGRRVPQSYGGGSGGAYKETIIVKVLLDKKVIATATTVEQQRYRRNNPSQRRGGNAGGQTA